MIISGGGAIMLAYQVRPLDPHIVGDSWREKWLERLEEMPLWMAQWMEHQTRDAYWKHGSVCENYDEIEVPVLAIDGWEDSYTNTVLSLMKGLFSSQKGGLLALGHTYTLMMEFQDQQWAFCKKLLNGGTIG
ncbi:CocE/NonD family hydrolase [Peribacillus frigoritolerans]|nr:CocE/NonD family hydrolase [Peribacillus frigoritolerans]